MVFGSVVVLLGVVAWFVLSFGGCFENWCLFVVLGLVGFVFDELVV